MCRPMADWSDDYSGHRVDSLARLVALRHHYVRVGGLIPRLGSYIYVKSNISSYVEV